MALEPPPQSYSGLSGAEDILAAPAVDWDTSASLLGVGAVFIGAVPAAQVIAAHVWGLRGWRAAAKLPVYGGARTLVLQSISWAMWFASILIACPVLLSRWRLNGAWAALMQRNAAHIELLSVSAAIGAVCALLFLLQSLMVYSPSRRPLQLKRQAFGQGQKDIALDVNRLPSRWVSYYVVCGMGLLWVLMAGSLLLATEFVPDTTSRLGYYTLAAICGTAGAFSTYGLAGHLRWSRAVHRNDGARGRRRGGGEGGSAAPSGWRFFQPLKGGAAFVASQALGWTLYSTALAAILYLIWQAVLGTAAAVAFSVRRWVVAAGAAMFVAQLVLVLSLATFKGPEVVQGIAERTLPPTLTTAAGFRRVIAETAIICMCYVQVHIFAAVVALTYMALEARTASLLWAGTLFLYYSLTRQAFGQPEHTGRREWPALKSWVSQHLEDVIRRWLGSFEVVKVEGAAFDPKRKYIFGYVPHGLYPIYAGLLPLTPTVQAALDGVRPVTLTASICFLPPVLRDIMLWLGARVVSRRTFLHTMHERGAVVVVPGGQAELCMTHLLHSKTCAIYTGHKGFVRVAIEQGASLVPLIVMGEADSLHNLVDVPWLQRISYKTVGFPVPFLLMGWCGLPLPSATGMRCIIGAPLAPPRLAPGAKPTQGQVDELHSRFYSDVERLWLAHSDSFPSARGVELVLTDQHL